MTALKNFLKIAVASIEAWWEDKAPRLGAALAFYTIFSLAPLLLIILGIVGLVFGEVNAQTQLMAQLTDLVGEEGRKALLAMVENARKPESGTMAIVIGFVVLLFGAAAVFGQLQDALNTIWKVEPKPGRGIWGIIQDRFLSFTMVLGVAFLLLVSLTVSALLTGFTAWFGEWSSGWLRIGLNELVSVVAITLLFAMLFKYLPDAQVQWKQVWLGASLTACLFVVGKFLIGLYLGQSAVASSYGAAGSMVVLLLWLYYSAQIFLLGAEFTRVYAEHHGGRPAPARNAEALPHDHDFGSPRLRG